jgi:hypothetical protein
MDAIEIRGAGSESTLRLVISSGGKELFALTGDIT